MNSKKMLISFNRIHDPYFSPTLRCRQRAREQFLEAGEGAGGHRHGPSTTINPILIRFNPQ